jgi:hypothetical protein
MSAGGHTPRRVGLLRTALALAALACVALPAAGCGGGSPSGRVAQVGSTTTEPASSPGASSPGSGVQGAVAGAVRFAGCMRSNGVTDYPDPTGGGRPQSLNRIDPGSPAFLAAYRACRKYASNGVGAPPEPSPAELRSALAFARCVRRHGFPQFPDPLTTVSLQATFTLGRGKYFPVNSSYTVQSPAFLTAARACGVQLDP